MDIGRSARARSLRASRVPAPDRELYLRREARERAVRVQGRARLSFPRERATTASHACVIREGIAYAPHAILDSAKGFGDTSSVGPPLGMGIVALGAALLLWGIAASQLRDLFRGTPMLARVTGHGSFVDRGQQMYTAYFAVTIDGETITGSSSTALTWKSPAVGAVVPVRFRPGDEIPLKDSSASAYVGPAVLAVFGAVLVGVGVDVLRGGNPSWW